MKIAIDIMGGDHSPSVPLKALSMFLVKNPNVHFVLYGTKEALHRKQHYSNLKNASNITLVECSEKVNPTDKTRDVLRKKQSSLYRSVKDTADKKVDVIVSAGNTGALLTLSYLLFGLFKGLPRPALTVTMPSRYQSFIQVLDLGANVQFSPQHLIGFAILGSMYVKYVHKIKKPRVGLFNIGSEASKGLEHLQKTSESLEKIQDKFGFSYIGYIEADFLDTAKCDVAVTDGYTGNMILKAIEGSIKFYFRSVKYNIKKYKIAYLGLPFLWPAIKAVYKLSPSRFNGAVMLGIQGNVVKSHGGATAEEFVHALSTAKGLVDSDFIAQFDKEFHKHTLYLTDE